MEKRKLIRTEYKALLSIFSLILIMESQLLVGSRASINLILAMLLLGYFTFVASLFFLIKPLLNFRKQ